MDWANWLVIRKMGAGMWEIRYSPVGHDAFTCHLTASGQRTLLLTGKRGGDQPDIEGESDFATNKSLVSSLWAYGFNEIESRRTRDPQQKKMYTAQSKTNARRTIATAKLIAAPAGGVLSAKWCSACLGKTSHSQRRLGATKTPAYLCESCGVATCPCTVPRCDNMAIRAFTLSSVAPYCAEHRHDIPAFSKLEERLESLDQYSQWLAFEKRNAARATKLTLGVVGGTVIVAPLALLAAPALGGALGAMTGLSGAAATSHGLALLGGGAIASGGLGMAGGIGVVTVAGAALGGSMGAGLTSSYVSSDKSFKIELLRAGIGTPVLVANGFLTEGASGWAEWDKLIDERYPDAPVYRVYWGAKELKDIGGLLMLGGGKQALLQAAKVVAKRSSKLARIPGLTAVFAAADIVTNPWTVAKMRANMTGIALAGILARFDEAQFVLVGHSLGGRVMATAAETLGTMPGKPRLEAVHLLGAAIAASKDWRPLNHSVADRVVNYYSKNDPVLNYVYRTAEAGRHAIGASGMNARPKNLVDRNVSRTVAGHHDYFSNMKLTPEAS